MTLSGPGWRRTHSIIKTKKSFKAPTSWRNNSASTPAKISGTDSFLKNNLLKPRMPVQPLEGGQTWRMAELNLQVGLVGKFPAHYKPAKPDAIRIKNSISGRGAVEKYLKKNKAFLIQGWPARLRLAGL
jgi:hypothetical protein